MQAVPEKITAYSLLSECLDWLECGVILSETSCSEHCKKEKGKGFPYSIPSAGPGADPGVQAVSPQVTVSHPPGGRLPLLSTRPAVTSPASEHHRPLAGTKLYCLVTEARRCKQLAEGCYAALPRVGFEPATYWSQVQLSTRYTTAPPSEHCTVLLLASSADQLRKFVTRVLF